MASGISQSCKPKRPFEQAAALGHRLSFAEPRIFVEAVIHSGHEYAAAGSAYKRQKPFSSRIHYESGRLPCSDSEHARKKTFVSACFALPFLYAGDLCYLQ